MSKKIKKASSLLLVVILLMCSVSIPVSAANPDKSNPKEKAFVNTEDTKEGETDDSNEPPTRYQKSIYSDVETIIYTGKGVDRWIHISPWLTPNSFTIRMEDYSGNTVWYQSFVTTGTTHWFVGSNVRYVYLSGIPGGVVDVTDTEH